MNDNTFLRRLKRKKHLSPIPHILKKKKKNVDQAVPVKYSRFEKKRTKATNVETMMLLGMNG